MGWHCIASQAHRTAADRASGGCAIASKLGIGITPHSHVRDGFSHRIHMTWIAGVLRGGIHFASVWLRDSEGLTAENLAILEEIACAIGKLRGPWIIGGDWNIDPDVLRSTNWLRVIGGVIVA
eukprot:8512703-Karenia_brevis.AAC.1